MMWVFCIGLIVGALLMNLAVEEEHKINEKLKKVINNIEDDLDNANSRVENRDNLINDLQEEHEILLENSAELRQTINELEEFKISTEEIIKSEDFTFDQIEKLKELVDLSKSN